MHGDYPDPARRRNPCPENTVPVDAHPMSVVVRTFTTMTRQPGHHDCPSCECGAPYGDHCRCEHLPWGTLSHQDRAILDLEARRYKYAGMKEQAIRELFDWSAARYYQALGDLLERPEALEREPTLVRRLRRLRDGRRGFRSRCLLVDT